MNFIRIAQASDFGVALTLHSLLESEGFTVEPVSNVGHISLAGAEQAYYIEVDAEQAEAALELLRNRGMQQHLLA